MKNPNDYLILNGIIVRIVLFQFIHIEVIKDNH